MKGREVGINIAFFVVVILVLFILLEIVLRISYPLYANFNTEMWRYSVKIKDLSDVPGVSHEHRPNKEAQLYGVRLATNSLGFRDKEYSVQKPEGVTRILLLGDSVTLGWGVEQEKMYSEVLERMLGPSYEVLNTAVGNYNTEMESLMLEQYADLDPDIVLVGFFPNDAEKTPNIKKGFSYFFKKSFYMYPFFWDRYMKLSYAFKTPDGKLTSRIHEFYSDEYGGKVAIDESFQRFRQQADEHGYEIVIAIIPQFYNEFDEYDSLYIHEYVQGLCEKYQFTCIDVLPAFQGHPLSDVIVSREDAHPNELGHRLIAERIFEVLQNG